jgi:hypothetical protein
VAKLATQKDIDLRQWPAGEGRYDEPKIDSPDTNFSVTAGVSAPALKVAGTYPNIKKANVAKTDIRGRLQSARFCIKADHSLSVLTLTLS